MTTLFDEQRRTPTGTRRRSSASRRWPRTGANGKQSNVAEGLTAADIYKRYAPGVVFIQSEIIQQTNNPFDFGFGGAQKSEATGSGFVIDAQRRHPHQQPRDRRRDQGLDHGRSSPTRRRVKATVVGKDPSTDLALLKVDPEGLDLRPLPLGSSKDVQVGDPTIAIGNPFGLDRTLTTGVVSALQRQIQAPNGFAIKDVIQTDAAINPGNSGGPLIDSAGRVIGINSQIETGGSGSEGNVGIGFAVPIDTAKQILSSLKTGEAVQRAYLGVTSMTVDGQLDALDLPADHGALVQTVEAGSPGRPGRAEGRDDPGDDAGLDRPGRPGRRHHHQGRRHGRSRRRTSSRSWSSAHKPGDKVKLEIVRKKGQTKDVTVTLTKRPAALQTG